MLRSCANYLLTHGVNYHQAVESFRVAVLREAQALSGSTYRAAKLAGVSRTMYYRPNKPLRSL